MNSQDKIKALNIVYMYWINSSNNIKFNALKIIQRFCRRGSGNHTNPRMITQKADFGNSIGPPVLYRQTCSCPEGKCNSIPIRNFNKFKRAQYCIKKLTKNMDEDEKDNFIQNTYLSQKRQMFLYETCYCNNKPFHCYKTMVTRPRLHYTTLKGLKYIMCELSGDHLTYYTRFKLSKFLTDRLS